MNGYKISIVGFDICVNILCDCTKKSVFLKVLYKKVQFGKNRNSKASEAHASLVSIFQNKRSINHVEKMERIGSLEKNEKSTSQPCGVYRRDRRFACTRRGIDRYRSRQPCEKKAR